MKLKATDAEYIIALITCYQYITHILDIHTLASRVLHCSLVHALHCQYVL
jgi:hypothetical protein